MKTNLRLPHLYRWIEARRYWDLYSPNPIQHISAGKRKLYILLDMLVQQLFCQSAQLRCVVAWHSHDGGESRSDWARIDWGEMGSDSPISFGGKTSVFPSVCLTMQFCAGLHKSPNVFLLELSALHCSLCIHPHFPLPTSSHPSSEGLRVPLRQLCQHCLYTQSVLEKKRHGNNYLLI